MKLDGKVALVTGAGSGIGKAIALLFAEEGANIAVNDINLYAGEETSAAVRRIGRKAITIGSDVAKADEVDAMMHMSIRELGGIHILVNNAGIHIGGQPVVDYPLESWEKTLNVNLRGSFLCSQYAGRWMVNNGGGNIVNIASVAGIIGLPDTCDYGPSKAGVINLTRVLAVEWAKYGIRVNAIAPSYIMTPLTERGISEGFVTLDELVKQIPLRRLGQPEEVAKAALFLASEDASFITGSTLPVDGGMLSYGYQSV
jgi:NAD(P)-dependent dehydrogenase (short-subunit alcohol dehydrogenase family)